MPEIDEGLGEVAGVDALSSNMRLATICEIRNAQWAVGVVRA